MLSDISIVTNILKKSGGKFSWGLLNRRISTLGMEILLLKNNRKRHEKKEQDILFLYLGISSELFQKYQQ